MSNPAYVTDNVDEMLASQYNNALDFSRRNMPDYKFSITVATNDITIALQHADGTDPSVSDPLIFRIGNSYRTINAALSITIADGTNWFNAGAPEFGGNLMGFFVYLVYDSNSTAIALTISRIPWARLISDFSATTTNEKHCYNYANFTSTDDCINIGYFEATLSLVATSYLWTVPTFTGANNIPYPTFETRQLTFVPQFTNLTLGNGTLTASYQIMRNRLIFTVSLTFGTTTSISGDVSHALPFSCISAYTNIPSGTLRLNDASVGGVFGFVQISGTTTVQMRCVNAAGTYAAAAAFSSTVPFTWTTSDGIFEWLQYLIN